MNVKLSYWVRYSGSFMSVHVLFQLLNELRNRDKNARLAEHFVSYSQKV